MSTRGAWGFYDGKDVHKVTYNHSDSYPDWLGNQMVTFLKKFSLVEIMIMFDDILMVDERDCPKPKDPALLKFIKRANGEVKKLLQPPPANFGSGKKDWYWLLRNFQSDIEFTCKLGIMIDSFKFLSDGLFCEWAYIINLKDESLEFYNGFHKLYPPGRYAKIWKGKRPYVGADMYYPVGLIISVPIKDLPEKITKDSMPELYEEDE